MPDALPKNSGNGNKEAQNYGYAEFSEALEAEEADILAFDASFPKKEKKVLPCQQEYEIACAQLDE